MGTAGSVAVGGPAPTVSVPAATEARPTSALRWRELFQISVFWLALNAIWGGFEIFQQERSIQLLGSQNARPAIGFMDLLAAPIAMVAMPVMGSISDYTTSRWGRRKPFILFGSLTSAVALAGLALAPTFPVLLLFFLLLQLTSNVARGPFAGLVPDLVPERQVGVASGLMGMMIMLGLVVGYLTIWSGYLLDADFTLPVLALAALVGATGVGTFLWIPNGPPAKPREQRSWRDIALETFGRDILEQRSYLFLLGSRFFLLMGGGFFMNINVLFLEGAFGMDADQRAPWVLAGLAAGAIASVTGAIPGGRLSDRIGRKPVIYGSALVGGIGIAVIGLAPVPEVVIAGVTLLGLAYGAFLAVDWALMTDIIPKASAGRYMGFSNIVEALNGAIASSLGTFTMYLVGLALGAAIAARTAMLLGVAVFVAGALLLVPVREPRRATRGQAAAT